MRTPATLTRLGPQQPPHVFDRYPIWSPDGQQVMVFSNRLGGGHAPTVMDTLGGNVARIGDARIIGGLIAMDWGAVPD